MDGGHSLYDQQLLGNLSLPFTLPGESMFWLCCRLFSTLTNWICHIIVLPGHYHVRPLRSDDYHRGHLELLSQLTSVGEVDETKYLGKYSVRCWCCKQFCLIYLFVCLSRRAIQANAIECRLLRDGDRGHSHQQIGGQRLALPRIQIHSQLCRGILRHDPLFWFSKLILILFCFATHREVASKMSWLTLLVAVRNLARPWWRLSNNSRWPRNATSWHSTATTRWFPTTNDSASWPSMVAPTLWRFASKVTPFLFIPQAHFIVKAVHTFKVIDAIVVKIVVNLH